MKLSYILNQLASGELSNLHLAEDNQTIKETKLPIVIRRINAALNDLHTRFLISIAEVDVTPVDGKYTVDAEDFLELIDVYVEDTALIRGKEYSLLKPNVFKLKMNLGIEGPLQVHYKTCLKELTLEDAKNDSEVALPIAYLNALLFFVAAKSFTSPVNQMDGDLNEGISYYRRYQEELQMLTAQGVDVEELEETNQFHSKGFI